MVVMQDKTRAEIARARVSLEQLWRLSFGGIGRSRRAFATITSSKTGGIVFKRVERRSCSRLVQGLLPREFVISHKLFPPLGNNLLTIIAQK